MQIPQLRKYLPDNLNKLQIFLENIALSHFEYMLQTLLLNMLQGGHIKHELDPSDENLPASHWVHSYDATSENVPAGHALQKPYPSKK